MSNSNKVKVLGCDLLRAAAEGIPGDWPGPGYSAITAADGSVRWVQHWWIMGYRQNTYEVIESNTLKDLLAIIRNRQVQFRKYQQKRMCYQCGALVFYLWPKPETETEYCMRCVKHDDINQLPLRPGVNKRNTSHESYPGVTGSRTGKRQRVK